MAGWPLPLTRKVFITRLKLKTVFNPLSSLRGNAAMFENGVVDVLPLYSEYTVGCCWLRVQVHAY